MSDTTMVRLRDLGRWSGGNTPSKANPEYWSAGSIPWVSPKDMRVEEIGSSEDRISERAVKDGRASILAAGAVLVVTRSGILAHTLPVAVTTEPVTINQDLKALTPKCGVSPKYVAHALRGASRRILNDCSKHGTTVASVETSALLDFEIPMVPLDAQLRVVAEIEKQFSRLDEAIANLQRVKAHLKRYTASVLKAAMEGRLVETEASIAPREKRSFESGAQLVQRVVEERRAIRTGRKSFTVPNGPCRADLPDPPAGWTWSCMEAVADRVTVGHVGSMKNEYLSSGIPFLRSQNVRANRFDAEGLKYVSPAFHASLGKSALSPGDIVVVRSGSVGVSCVIPESLPVANCSDLVIIKAPRGVDPQFGAYYLNSVVDSRIAAGRVGVALVHFNTQAVAELPLPLPPLAEQRRIVAEVDRRFSIVREVEAEVDANLKRAQALREATLTKAFCSRSQPR